MLLPEFKDNKQLNLFCAAQYVEIFDMFMLEQKISTIKLMKLFYVCQKTCQLLSHHQNHWLFPSTMFTPSIPNNHSIVHQ